jgi:hypothetical protein
MSVGGITRSPSISINDDDEEQQELEEELYASALQSSLGISSDDPNSPDNDANDPAAISTGTAAISAGAQGTQQNAIGESRGSQASESLRSTLSADDRVSEPAPARSQATKKVIGMRGGSDPMLSVFAMEAQRESAPEPNVVKSKENVG